MTNAIKRATNALVLAGLLALLVFLFVAWWTPPSAASTPGTPPATLDECVSAYYALDADTFAVRQDLDEARRSLVLVEGDRARLVDEVERLGRRVERQAVTIARLRERLGR